MGTVIITNLFDLYILNTGLSHWRVSALVANDGKFYSRLIGGGGVTIKTYNRTIQWFSDNWPLDLQWPYDIPRPTPAADSQAAIALAEAKAKYEAEANTDILGFVKRLHEQAIDLMAKSPVDWGAIEKINALTLSKAMVLDSSSRLASPDAICLTLGVSRNDYDQVIANYKDGGRTKGEPRRGRSKTRQIFDVLIKAGDVRFSNRIQQKAKAAVLLSGVVS